jgi:tetratricopeptide (TPR) repeat protein
MKKSRKRDPLSKESESSLQAKAKASETSLSSSEKAPRKLPRATAQLGFFVAGALAWTLTGMALLEPVAGAYLLALPENYRERIEAALDRGDAAGALAAFEAERRARPYNFAAVWLLADRAEASGDAALQREALSAVFQSFEAFEAVRHREVFAVGWSEGEALRRVGRLMLALDRPEASRMAWDAAANADPAWTPAKLSAWLDALPREARMAWDAARDATLEAGSSAPPPRPAPERLLFPRDGRPETEVFPFYSRGVWEGAVPNALSGAQIMTLAARGTPAFEGWPCLLLSTDAGEALGFLRVNSVEWRVWEVKLLRPLQAGETLRLAYRNDLYDAKTKEDRNAWVAWIAASSSL